MRRLTCVDAPRGGDRAEEAAEDGAGILLGALFVAAFLALGVGFAGAIVDTQTEEVGPQ